ncbi:Histone deacetylase complex subunit SAP18 like protein [Argiope bruennichi]|uniref:18 kDa Sin3-associated polypeptide n=1 Tax=Argiope bruennichi TaxID=94029 RepID=A0A8T0EXD0_ARGBR|nr:Histone deacetylase complex subunit SAP18 like protein [Argiope bruennichi]
MGLRKVFKEKFLKETCPLLLRVFLNNGRHHSLSEFVRGNVPPNELQIYTWLDATLKELTNLVKEVNPDARRKGTFFWVAPSLFQKARGFFGDYLAFAIPPLLLTEGMKVAEEGKMHTK